jgi:hypothetical protein
MKPSKTFKLTKRNKTLLALLPSKDEHVRGDFRRMMIQAQLQGEVKVKVESRKTYAGGQPAVVAV